MALCAGFLQQFAAVVDESRPHMHIGKVLAELSSGRVPNRVLCTGHSLGGALATLGAASAFVAIFLCLCLICSIQASLKLIKEY